MKQKVENFLAVRLVKSGWMESSDDLSPSLLDMVPDKAGFVCSVQVRVQTEVGAEALLTHRQQLITWSNYY